jgi:hypothetical protein
MSVTAVNNMIVNDLEDMALVEQNERRIWTHKPQGVGLKIHESIKVFYITCMPMYDKPLEKIL